MPFTINKSHTRTYGFCRFNSRWIRRTYYYFKKGGELGPIVGADLRWGLQAGFTLTNYSGCHVSFICYEKYFLRNGMDNKVEFLGVFLLIGSLACAAQGNFIFKL